MEKRGRVLSFAKELLAAPFPWRKDPDPTALAALDLCGAIDVAFQT